MNGNKRARQTHRVTAAVFTATVVVAIAVSALRGPVWVAYLPLPPLALLLFSGLFLYVLSFVATRRGRRAGNNPPPGPRDRSRSQRARSLHRWAAAAFTMTVLATFIAFALPEPLIWVSYLPLLPLAALLFSGLYLLVRFYRTARRDNSEDTTAGPIDRRSAAVESMSATHQEWSGPR